MFFMTMDSCTDCMAFEFQPENVSPFYDDYRVFVRPQWPCISQLVYVCYRVIVAILICVWVCIDFFEEGQKFYPGNFGVWFIFATNWGFLILAISAIVRACAAIWFQCNPAGSEIEHKPNSVPFMVLWILYNIAANCALVVTLSYWTFLTAFDTSGFLQTHMSQIKHTLNTAYIVSDLVLSAIPIRIFHLIYPMFVGAIYTVFNALYFINDGMGPNGKPYAYYVMDWRNPIESAVTCSVGFVLTTVVQSLLYGIYRLRIYLFKKYFDRRNTDVTSHREDQVNGIQPVPTEEVEEAESILSEHRERSTTTYNAVDPSEVIEMIDETPPSPNR